MGFIDKFLNRVRRVKEFLVPRNNERFILKSWRPLFELKYASQLLECKRFTQQIRPRQLEEIKASTVMIIAPHPDDELFGCGGSLLKWDDGGHEYHIVYLTTPGENEEVKEAIRNESRQVSDALSCQAHFLEYEPGYIPASSTEFKDLLISIKPNKIFVTFVLDDHDDHRRANELLLSTLLDVENKPEIWSYQIYSTVLPNAIVEITEQMEKKSSLMKIYKSVSGERDWAHYVKGLNAMNCRYIQGKRESYGEAFFILDSKEYVNMCKLYFNNSAKDIYTKYYL